MESLSLKEVRWFLVVNSLKSGVSSLLYVDYNTYIEPIADYDTTIALSFSIGGLQFQVHVSLVPSHTPSFPSLL